MVMAEPIVLYILVWRSPCARHNAWRVLDTNPIDGSISKQHKKINRFLLATISLFLFPPYSAGNCQMRAGRVCYHQIPTIAQDIAHITLVVLARYLSRQQVATPGVMSTTGKCLTNNSAKLAGD